MDHISKSTRLRNTSIIYYKVIKLLNNLDKGTSPLRSPKKRASTQKIRPQRKEILPPTSIPSSDKTKKLNSYQLFVRSESKKDIYSGMNAKDRMQQISKKWKKINK